MTTTERRYADDLNGENLKHAAVFGFCPDCHCEPEAYVNIGKEQWMYCPDCKTTWCWGYNLFTSWRFETEEEQREKSAFLWEEGYREVKPYCPGD